MSTSYSLPDLLHGPPETLENGPPVSDEVRRQAWTLLAGLFPPSKWAERRSEQRFPYAHLVYLTPLAADGVTPEPPSIVVVGKTLSEHGLGFFHQQVLPYRRMIASLEANRGEWVGFLIDIKWCRFTQHGWYDSGGRFLQVVPSPIKKTAPSPSS